MSTIFKSVRMMFMKLDKIMFMNQDKIRLGKVIFKGRIKKNYYLIENGKYNLLKYFK